MGLGKVQSLWLNWIHPHIYGCLITLKDKQPIREVCVSTLLVVVWFFSCSGSDVCISAYLFPGSDVLDCRHVFPRVCLVSNRGWGLLLPAFCSSRDTESRGLISVGKQGMVRTYRDELGRGTGELSQQIFPPAITVVGSLNAQPWAELTVKQVIGTEVWSKFSSVNKLGSIRGGARMHWASCLTAAFLSFHLLWWMHNSKFNNNSVTIPMGTI